MDAPVGSLPSRPLKRTEIEAFPDYAAIDNVFPIYGQQSRYRNAALGVVIQSGDRLYAIAYRGDEWHKVSQAEIEDPASNEREGIPWNAGDTLSALQDEIESFLSQ